MTVRLTRLVDPGVDGSVLNELADDLDHLKVVVIAVDEQLETEHGPDTGFRRRGREARPARLGGHVGDVHAWGAAEVAMIIPGRHSGGMQQPTAVQRLVDAMLDRAERDCPGVEFMIWLPSLESLLLPRDSDRGGYHGAAAPRVMQGRYRGRRIQAFDNCGALTAWVSPAGGVPAPSQAPTYVGDLLAEHFTAC